MRKERTHERANPPKARLVVATNIPTPYRLAFFEVLSHVLAEHAVGFEVLFYAATEPSRRWKLDLASQSYILPGLHPCWGRFTPHINPSLPFELRGREPTWVLIAGAWNTPSSLLAASRLLSGPGYRLFWSEGHAQAVLHATGPIALARRACLAHFDGFAVPNARSEQFIRDELGRPASCLRLPNTIDEEFYLAGASAPRDDLRRSLGLSDVDDVVLCVAELSARKGLLELVESIRLLSEKVSRHALFVFAGDGPLRASIEALGRSRRVRLLGHIPQTTVRDWMYASDLFVLPSKVDPNPLSAIEAAFCGMPIIISERAGNAEDLVGQGAGGWLLRGGEPSQFALVLETALMTPARERQELGAQARKTALLRFARRDVARRFADDLMHAFPIPGRDSVAVGSGEGGPSRL
jgi:glycosyltransferase involved in cell wall biosynthesis